MVFDISRFSNLGHYKNIILSRFIQDENLVKAIYYNSDDFVSQGTLSNPASLINTQIFPYPFVPEINDEAKTYISMSFGDFKLTYNTSFVAGLIAISVITHKNLVLLDPSYGMLRYDYIINRIDTLLDETNSIGAGKLEFADLGDFRIPDTNWVGATIVYRPVDFR